MTPSQKKIKIDVTTRYLEDQSVPAMNRYVFAYTIIIKNLSNISAQLVARHWVITDANGKIEEVHGEGVVGEKPYLSPGESFEYTSGAIIRTPVGTMEGSYKMVTDDGTEFRTPIPAFTLAVPRVLH